MKIDLESYKTFVRNQESQLGLGPDGLLATALVGLRNAIREADVGQQLKICDPKDRNGFSAFTARYGEEWFLAVFCAKGSHVSTTPVIDLSVQQGKLSELATTSRVASLMKGDYTNGQRKLLKLATIDPKAMSLSDAVLALMVCEVNNALEKMTADKPKPQSLSLGKNTHYSFS